MYKKILLLSFLFGSVAMAANAQLMQNTQEQTDEEEPRSVFIADYDVEQVEYKQCLSKIINGSPAGYISCLNQEIKRQHASIENFYRTLLKQEQFQKWNGDATLAKGNFRDMNEQFVAFRDRLCSLYALSKLESYENIEWGRKECVMEFNDYMLNRLQTIKRNSDADVSEKEDFDEEAYDEDEE